MKPENAIEVKDITKKFKIYLDKGHTLKEKTLFRRRRTYEERKVLNGISFEVKKGEAVGLIGHNGCGKSTTLKLLTKIMYPDSGTIEMSGRVSSLIELGAGFHPDMSGRENIYINASIFGLSKKEIDGRMDEIVEFSELEEFIDHPVRTYSSGMYMRLAFSVAINVKADILLIDEILAVGDANFQAKCFERLREIKAEGITIVLVSHSLGQIEQICDKSIWLDCGIIKGCGTPREVHPMYLDYMGKKRKTKAEQEKNAVENTGSKTESTGIPKRKEVGTYDIKITHVELLDKNGRISNTFSVDEKIIINIEYECRNDQIQKSGAGFHIFRSDGVDCYGSNTFIDQLESIRVDRYGTVRIELAPVLLLGGRYRMDVAFHDEFGLTYHHIYDAAVFEILNPYDEAGISRIRHKWFVNGKELERK